MRRICTFDVCSVASRIFYKERDTAPVLVLQIFDAAFLNGLAHKRCLFQRAFAHGVNGRQGWLAFGQIVTDVLGQRFAIAA
jgi:hypothetical protein